MNSTKLSAFCDRVIEVGWLAAVIVTPLFFNVYSSRIFDPDRIAVLRTIALVMAAVWMVKLLEERASGNRDVGCTWRTPLVLPTLFMVVVYLVSTALSVTPWVSLFGSYSRLQGTFTTFSYVVVFLMILQGMCTRAQLDRLVTIIIVNSLPVALYGLIQRYGLDPLPWADFSGERVDGSMGNPIFLAAYLVMVFPLTLGRAAEGFRAILVRERTSKANKISILCTVGYVLIAAVQLITTWYTQSRGPLLALVAGSFFFLLLLALAWRSRWGAILIVTAITLTALVVGSIVLVNVSGGPLQSAPWLGRLGQVFSFARILYWQGMVDLVLPHEPLQYPDGHKDPFNPIRPLVGYGPESIRVAYTRFRPPMHWRYEAGAVDRAHNETFDALATTGLLGLIVYLFLFLSAFYYGFIRLGLLEEKGQRMQLMGLVLVCCLASVAFSWWQVGPHFFGVALAMGIVAGLAIYLGTLALVFAIRMLTLGESTLPPLHAQHLLILSLLSAIVTHFVEINFGIAVAATRTTFWACAGLLVVAGLDLRESQRVSESASQRVGESASRRVSESASQPDEGTSRRRKKRRQKQSAPSSPTSERTPAGWLWPTLGNAIVGGFILGTLAFDFVVSLTNLSDPGRILWRALTTLPTQGERTSYGILMIMLLTWLVMGLIFLSEMARRGTLKARPSDWLPASLLYLTVSLGLGLAFALLLAGHLAALVPPPPPPMGGGGGQGNQVAQLMCNPLASRMTLYYGFVALVLLAGGLALMRERTLPRASATTWGPVALIPLLVLSGVLAVQYNLAPIQANMIYRQADPYDREGAWDVALAHYERASELAPHADVYYLELGRAYSQKASSTGDPAQQERLFQLAEQSLIQARDINPLEYEHSVNLAGLYRHRHDLASDPAQKEQWGEQASANYEIATTLATNDAALWNALGDSYSQLGQLEKAAGAYERVLELAPRSTGVWRTLGSTYAQLGRLEEGIAAMQEALELEPEAENAWNSHLILAVLYSQLGRPEEALSHAQTAWQLAPEEEKPALQDMITQLQQEQ